MKNKMNYDDIVFRIGYFRNKRNLSARETSLRLGFSDSFVNRIERKSVELKVSTLLNFLDLVEVDIQEFVYPNIENYKEDSELLKMINSLSEENKLMIKDIIKKIK